MKNKYLLLLFTICIIISCNDEQSAGAADTNTYIKFFGANNADIAYMSQSTSDGGSVLLGTTEVEIKGVSSFKIKVIKVDENGNELWQKVYPPFEPSESDLATSYIGRSIIVVDDGYLVVGDSIKSDESSPSSLLVMKLNDSPNDDTSPTLAIDHIDKSDGIGLQGIDIILDSDGNYRVLANSVDGDEIVGSWFGTITDSGNSLSFDANIDCFYSIDGNVSLVKSLYETSAGDFVFGGTNKSQTMDNAIIYEVPACQNGFSGGATLLVNNPQEHYVAGQIIPNNSGYAMVGTRTATAGPDVFFSLFSSNGVPIPGSLTIYEDHYPGIGTEDEHGFTIAHTAEGGYIIGGYTLSDTAGEEDILLIKTNAFGNIQWSKTIGNINQEEAVHIRQAEDGGYYVFANTKFGGIDTMVLIKTDKNGNVD